MTLTRERALSSQGQQPAPSAFAATSHQGPIDLCTSRRTALLPTSLRPPQQRGQLTSQTPCKTLTLPEVGHGLSFINTSECTNRHQDSGSAATCTMIAPSSPCHAPNPLSSCHVLCREMTWTLGTHLKHRPPNALPHQPPLPPAHTPALPLATLTRSPETHLPLPAAPYTIIDLLSWEKTLPIIGSSR